MSSKRIFNILFQQTNKNFLIQFKRMNSQMSAKQVKKLFTPGPLLTSLKVKEAMLVDYGSRDIEFINTIEFVRNKLLDIAGVTKSEYECVLMQGSGTFGNESVIQTTSNEKSNYLILENGAYGVRLNKICKLLNINTDLKSFDESRAIDLNRVEEILRTKSPNLYTHVAVIHNETTSGVLNDVNKIGQMVKKYFPDSIYIVDSMSAFGAVPVNPKESQIDFLVTSSNKCIESVPGFAIVICNKEKLLKYKNNSKSLSLDLYDQYENLEKTKQFRFTPPTHSINAFKQALVELEAEGGPVQRYKRYSSNHSIVRTELLKLGFKELVPLEEQGKIINTFYYPKDKNFIFEEFYRRLSNKGQIIYPGKMTKAECFRIGNIGTLYENDMNELVDAIKDVCNEMDIKLPLD